MRLSDKMYERVKSLLADCSDNELLDIPGMVTEEWDAREKRLQSKIKDAQRQQSDAEISLELLRKSRSEGGN
jgi:hypothetical protein